jgi:diguanylate cyclase (GGDEF)-like protein/PAS domain S-box-containing protein
MSVPGAAVFVLRAHRGPAGDIIGFTHVEANDPALAWLGRPAEEVLGRTASVILPDLSAEDAFVQRCRVVETGERFGSELAAVSGGMVRCFAREVTKCGDGVAVVVRDVTDRNALQRDLAESESRYRSVVHTLAEGVVLQAEDGQIIECNPAAERILGLSRDQLLQRTSQDPRWQLVHADGSPFPGELHPSTVSLRTGMSSWGTILGVDRADGSRGWILINAEPVRRPGEDRPNAVVTSFTDITEIRRVQNALRASQERFRAALGAIDDLFILAAVRCSPDGGITDFAYTYVNAVATRLLGRSEADLVGRSMIETAADGVQGLFDLAVDVMATGRSSSSDLPWTAEHGSGGTFRVHGSRFGQDVILTGRDVTGQLRSERALAESEELFRLAFEESVTGMAVLDVDPPQPGRFLRVNQAMCQVMGYLPAEFLGLGLNDVVDPDDRVEAMEAFARVVDGRVETYRSERRLLTASGATIWALVGTTLVRDPDGVPLYVLGQIEDVTARKRAEAQLMRQALYDDLTGLPNRTQLLDHLAAALARARRVDSIVGLLFLDLDDFKSINDSFGHLAGDELLVRVGERITGALRETDTAARIGGDEFLILCENLTAPSDAALLAERIQGALNQEIRLPGGRVTTSASIGIAVATPDSTPESLLRDADAAMYVAKRRGGRRWEPADSLLHVAAMRLITLDGQLRQAIHDGELRMHYQPTIDLGTGRLVGVEALLRWQHPERGLLLPTEFLDVAEQRNLMNEIGGWALATACAQAASWVTEFGPAAPTVAVNVSSRQLADEGLPTLVRQTLDHTGLAPERLCLEITETTLVAVGSSATTDLLTLSALGVRIAVDDFGTGYAGYGYLRRLPIDELKIGKSFIDGLGPDHTDTAITTSIIALGASLGLTVVAEGIETVEQRDTLRDLGCTWGQGWFWQPAIPADQISPLIRAGHSPPDNHHAPH